MKDSNGNTLVRINFVGWLLLVLGFRGIVWPKDDVAISVIMFCSGLLIVCINWSKKFDFWKRKHGPL
jgi:hypothetical protein